MAATMEAAMFIMIYMYGYVCAYVFVHAYMCACACICIKVWGWHHPFSPPTHPLAAKGGDPLKQYKFNMSWTNRDKWILFVDLKSV